MYLYYMYIIYIINKYYWPKTLKETYYAPFYNM